MKANILVIDDEESIRFSFHRFLRAQGHIVITAESYGEALEKMDKIKFVLILADVFLADGCGLDILREVMWRSLKTRVIIITAYSNTKTAQDSFRMRAADYLVKPIKMATLLDSVNNAIQQ